MVLKMGMKIGVGFAVLGLMVSLEASNNMVDRSEPSSLKPTYVWDGNQQVRKAIFLLPNNGRFEVHLDAKEQTRSLFYIPWGESPVAVDEFHRLLLLSHL
jgi:hypothetical protein